jgi:hypothetical protein
MGCARLGFAALFLMLVAIAPASASAIQQQLNVNLSVFCNFSFPAPPPYNCSEDAGVEGRAESGSADFSSVAPGWTFNFQSAAPLSFCLSTCSDGNQYEARFRYGGTFNMTGPAGLGLTFNGVMTSGFSYDLGNREWVNANFIGQWSNGLHASGKASVGIDRPLNVGGAFLSTSIVPEPSSLALLCGGVIALATRVAPSLKDKLKKLAIA